MIRWTSGFLGSKGTRVAARAFGRRGPPAVPKSEFLPTFISLHARQGARPSFAPPPWDVRPSLFSKCKESRCGALVATRRSVEKNVVYAAPPSSNARSGQGWSPESQAPRHSEPSEPAPQAGKLPFTRLPWLAPPLFAASPAALCELETRAGSWMTRRRGTFPNRAMEGREPAFKGEPVGRPSGYFRCDRCVPTAHTQVPTWGA